MIPASSAGWSSTISDLVPVALRPAHVHAHQHLGPVRRVRSALARVDLEDRVVLVGFLGEHALDLDLAHAVLEALERLAGFEDDGGVARFVAELEERLRVLDIADELLEALHLPLEPRPLARGRLRALRVVPELGVGCLLVELRDSPLQPIDVKDAPGANRRALGDLCEARGSLADGGFRRAGETIALRLR